MGDVMKMNDCNGSGNPGPKAGPPKTMHKRQLDGHQDEEETASDGSTNHNPFKKIQKVIKKAARNQGP